ncbi:MAG: hypothetical protein A2534_00925 [Candidatus Magasanikbacteria bacterium RIFOXYD2_FULL_39_9]|uniref:Uncharacterized protein n=1 Tax=Candidatus Magasanikbacteria bacterium RIFOXYD1_FULL_40_23 TaxID=1798705 RepID=A0A1F6PBA2_9BACT|nr:MAG: hypothetical protein A2534_00925 [Candidatus Magasanikbacteria bacterium RIFOXYD2_FULL_39_9]OGH93439.1 MAG: hypothetical protein A2563_01480 [Candidatus Magasanikbacteria bacterium RIFOXYD1_FULL_40_23]
MNEKLKKEILLMVEDDQKMRSGDQWNSEIDRLNTERIKIIISQYGWPGKSLVGEEGANGVWLLVQHADHDVEFQKHALKFLQEAVANEEAEKSNEAYLVDRIKVNTGQPQLFGTQFYEDEKGQFGPRPIEDPENVEERRRIFGLEPFSEYQQLMERKHTELKNKEK